MADNPQRDENRNTVFNMDIHLDQRVDMHTRIISNIFDLLGELGGVLEVVVCIFLLFLYPFIRYNYFMKVFNSLYLAKTRNPTVFDQIEEPM